MAFFGVTIEEIEQITPIPGAERIVRAQLKGLAFQFVIPINMYSVGQKVLYIPIDSIVPASVQEKLGLVGKLSGKLKDRVKTIKLKGQYSQGIVGPLSLLDEYTGERTPEGITEYLQITKYEINDSEVFRTIPAYLMPLPLGLSKYDIEGGDRNLDIVEMLKPMDVCITEKLEGSNWSVSYDGETLWVNQRRFSIKRDAFSDTEGKLHPWWEATLRLKLDKFAQNIYNIFREPVTIYGEIIGPNIAKQGNLYCLKENVIKVFDMKVGLNYIDSLNFLSLCQYNNVETVPVIATCQFDSFLNNKPLSELAHGYSHLYSKQLREGIVIKPLIERVHPTFGRLFLKQRDPIYDERHN
jgi:RNA ligase (TIGR02306 family)